MTGQSVLGLQDAMEKARADLVAAQREESSLIAAYQANTDNIHTHTICIREMEQKLVEVKEQLAMLQRQGEEMKVEVYKTEQDVMSKTTHFEDTRSQYAQEQQKVTRAREEYEFYGRVINEEL